MAAVVVPEINLLKFFIGSVIFKLLKEEKFLNVIQTKK